MKNSRLPVVALLAAVSLGGCMGSFGGGGAPCVPDKKLDIFGTRSSRGSFFGGGDGENELSPEARQAIADRLRESGDLPPEDEDIPSDEIDRIPVGPDALDGMEAPDFDGAAIAN